MNLISQVPKSGNEWPEIAYVFRNALAKLTGNILPWKPLLSSNPATWITKVVVSVLCERWWLQTANLDILTLGEMGNFWESNFWELLFIEPSGWKFLMMLKYRWRNVSSYYYYFYSEEIGFTSHFHTGRH